MKKWKNERQVITEKEVDEVIGIMGQPDRLLWSDEDILKITPRPAKNIGKG